MSWCEGKNLYIVIAVVAIFILLLVYYYWCKSKKSGNNTSSKKPTKEGYVAAGGLDHVGSFDNYELIQSPDMEVPATHFADLVDEGCDQLKQYGVQQPPNLKEQLRPMERLHRECGSQLMPRTSLSVTPYNIDVAQPSTVSYMVNTPRVQLKSKYKDYSLAGFIRGDIPITQHPNIPLINKTHQGLDDLRLDGLFSDNFKSLYNKYTGKAFKNVPIMVAGAGQAACYGGASGETVMDNYS